VLRCTGSQPVRECTPWGHLSSGLGHATRGALFPACLNGITHATPACHAALLATRAAPVVPGPSLVIARENLPEFPVDAVILQPQSGATFTARYSNPTSDEGSSIIALDFRDLATYKLYITATPLDGATLGSLSCTASCGDGCTDLALSASGQSGQTDLQFRTGTTYTFTCIAAHASDTGTTTKTFEILLEGEGLQWATQRGQQFSTAGTSSVCQVMWGAGMAA